jgi:CheY-like chemotaxis protein
MLAGGSESILIVEDDPIVRETAVDTLTGLGYRVVAAGSLEQAKTALGCSAFDLLFTDYILPHGMTGDDVAAYALKAQPDIAILYTSGYQRDKPSQDMSSATEVSLIGKPYRKAQLAKSIRRLLDAHASKPKRSTV